MATAEDIHNQAVLHRIALNRYSTSLVRKVLAQLNRVDADLVARILRADNEGRDPRQLERMLEEIRALQADGWTVLRSRLNTDLDALAGAELDFAERLVRLGSTAASVDAIATAPSAAQVIAAVNSRPFQGRFLREWLSEAEEGAAKRVRETVRQGFIEGRSVTEIARLIRGTRALQYRDGILEISRRGAEAMVRTAVTHVSAVASQETYAAMGDLVVGVEWVSTLDSRTTVICAGRDGKVYPLDSGPRPPAHVNCRSTTIPRIRGLAPVERQTYAEWLRMQPPEVQDDILGVAKAKLFRAGKLTLDRFTDRTGRVLTLDQLKKRDAEALP
ncbi:minor capsid protein [Brevundimonas vesicularis]|uniref:minor capsid protein n=1 Tax=Brevundimonas vesicularis TaxID=41276 RepID=UPI0038504AA7